MVGPSRKSNGGMATVVNNYFDYEIEKYANVKYVETYKDGKACYRLLFGFIGILKVIIRLIFTKVDVLHVHMASRGSVYRKSIVIRAAYIMKKHVMIHLHGAEFQVFYENECSDKQKKYIAEIFKKADTVIVLSDEWKSKLESMFECNIKVINNAVMLPEKNYYNTESTDITFLGRLCERKGVYDLLKVIKPICSKYDNLRFVLAGDGDLEKVKQIIKSESLEDKVILTGWLNSRRKTDLMKKSVISILPSYNEGMPMSILESMSYGIPVISTNVGGIPQLIEDKINGYIINPGDIKNLELRIEELMDDKNKRASMSALSYKKIKNIFSIERHIKNIVEVYKCITEINI